MVFRVAEDLSDWGDAFATISESPTVSLSYMGNENKRGIKDKLKSGLTRAGDLADDAGANAKVAAGSIADQARKTKGSVDEKIRATLDAAYESKRQAAIENVARIKKANADLSPQEVLGQLRNDLKAADESSGEKTDSFTSAASLYILSVVEVHGAGKQLNGNSQKLVDVVIALDSSAAKTILALGGFAVTLLAKRFGPVGKALTAAAKLGGKAAVVASLVSLTGIKSPGKKGAAWAVIAATEKLLGEPPKSWPKIEASKSSATKAKKPSKPKTINK